jgi:hypothetical protein
MRYENAFREWENNNVSQALSILDDILNLSPRNFNAVKLKVEILEDLGLFEDVADLIREIAQIPDLSEEMKHFLRSKLIEERVAQFYVEHVDEGPLFISPPAAGFWLALIGVFTSLFFITFSHFLLLQNSFNQDVLFFSFLLLVVLPWFLLMIVNKKTVHSYLINSNGIILNSFGKRWIYKWEDMKSILIESKIERQLKSRKLSLKIELDDKKISIDLSSSSALFYCRKPFLKEFLKHAPCVYHYALDEDEKQIWKLSSPDNFSENVAA